MTYPIFRKDLEKQKQDEERRIEEARSSSILLLPSFIMVYGAYCFRKIMIYMMCTTSTAIKHQARPLFLYLDAAKLIVYVYFIL